MPVKSGLRINLCDIPEQGLEFAADVSEELISKREDDDFHFVAPLKIKARIERMDDMIIARAHIDSTYASICSRCLEEANQQWSGDYILDFPVDRKTEFIDMTDDIRQEVILSFPARTLCNADCKGLCLGCGANLNNDSCNCKK